MLAGEPSTQWQWHEAYRDLAKNQFRTSYTDMIHCRETCVRSDFPAGYGGHIPSIRYDLFHRNTAQDRQMALQKSDPDRDALPSFELQLKGLPSVTAHPGGARKNPTKGVVPHSGCTTNPKAPWGILVNGRLDQLNQHCTPGTIRRSLSSLSLVGAGTTLTSEARRGRAAAPDPNSPTAQLRDTVARANKDATSGSVPSEAEVLAASRVM